MISQKPKFRETEDLYIGAYKTMAFFEEAADTIATEAHNLQTISLNQIDPMNGKEFYFNVTVNNFSHYLLPTWMCITKSLFPLICLARFQGIIRCYRRQSIIPIHIDIKNKSTTIAWKNKA